MGRESSRGSAIVMALFVLVLLGAMGVALLFVTQNEMRMSKASNEIKRTFYLAESGVEDGRRTLYDANGPNSFDDDIAKAAGANAVLDLDPAALRPVYDDRGRVTGISGAGDDEPLRAVTSLDQGYYAAFLSNDPLEAGGRGDLDDTNDRVMVIGVGVGVNGSMEVAEAILEPVPMIPALPPAALTMLGPDPHFRSGASPDQTWTGEDCQGTGMPGYYVPTVGVIGADAEADAEAGLEEEVKGKTVLHPEMISDPALTTREETVSDLTDMSDPLVHGPVDPDWLSCEAMHEMIDGLRTKATHYCKGTDCVLPAPTGFSDVTFIDNGHDTSDWFDIDSADKGTEGRGLLVVTGAAVYHGGRGWEGVVMVVGRGMLERRGGGGETVSGAMIVADIAGPDDIYGTDDDCENGFEPAFFEVEGGGNSTTAFCSDHIDQSNPPLSYAVVEFLQH